MPTRLLTRLLALATLATAFPTPAWAAPAQTPTDPPLPPDVRAVVRQLDDRDPAVRLDAVQRLRLLARRVDAPGAQRVRRGGEFDPEVPGLVPHLVRAAGDRVEANRVAALHALADTLDPAAVVALRAALKDDSDAVRLAAACLLTEYHDTSGLAEMKRALARFREKPKADRPFEVERLLASFQRATGKSFGDIPRNPALASDGRTAAASEKRYRELLDAWAGWWAWEPGK
jgi:HEAT repeat protein